MAQFLSHEWFDDLAAAWSEGAGPSASGRAGGAGGAEGDEVPNSLVVEISVAGAPEGEVRYQVVVEGARARVVPPGAAFRPAQVELTSDYPTMAGIASGKLSAVDALSLGRARVSGDTAALSNEGGGLAGLDLVPPAVRERTTF